MTLFGEENREYLSKQIHHSTAQETEGGKGYFCFAPNAKHKHSALVSFCSFVRATMTPRSTVMMT